MSVLIWIQTVWHSDSVPERIFWKSLFWKSQQTTTKSWKITQHAELILTLLSLNISYSDLNWLQNIYFLTLCMLGNFHGFCWRLLTFFKVNFFQKILSGTLSECQTMWLIYSLYRMVTLKIMPRSPKSNQLFTSSRQCIYASLVKINQLVQKITHVNPILETSKCWCDLEN